MKPDDPVSQGAARAIEHLDADRTGLDLIVITPVGGRPVRVDYEEPIEGPASGSPTRLGTHPRPAGVDE